MDRIYYKCFILFFKKLHCTSLYCKEGTRNENVGVAHDAQTIAIEKVHSRILLYFMSI